MRRFYKVTVADEFEYLVAAPEEDLKQHAVKLTTVMHLYPDMSAKERTRLAREAVIEDVSENSVLADNQLFLLVGLNHAPLCRED